MDRRVFIIGLDSAPPELVFDRWLDDLPNIKRLQENGIYGRLESTIPPITVPAWMSMMTGKDPGQLGFYGFRNRKDYSYDSLSFANSRMVKEDTVWDILSRIGKKVVVLGVPLTYPPKQVNGCLISGFLAPSTESEYTYPAELKSEIEEVVGDYMLDVRNFRTDDKSNLLAQIYEMTEKRFKLVRHLMSTKEWDFFIFVEMGPDRIHHGFWRYFDETHMKYEPGSRWQNAVKDYYVYLDGEIGETISTLKEDTVVFVVSDHGAKRMDGGICFNEWLMREGYLVLKSKPEGIVRMDKMEIDWGRTLAWGDGGYYGRLFLNVKGREPNGLIPSADYERIREELTSKLVALTDENGRNIGTKVFRPDQIYAERRNVAPDLIVHFGDLYWRSVGSVGHGTIWTHENDIGPDDANHSMKGIFLISDPKDKTKHKEQDLSIYDIAPTILSAMGIPTPNGIRVGRSKAKVKRQK